MARSGPIRHCERGEAIYGSYDLTRLENRHVVVEGSAICFEAAGSPRDKNHPRLQELPGQDLLQYFDESGQLHAVTSGHVNSFWGDQQARRDGEGLSHLGGNADGRDGPKRARRLRNDLSAQSASRPRARFRQFGQRAGMICRKCYLHPHGMSGYPEKKLVLEIELTSEDDLIDRLASLRPEETALLVLAEIRRDRGCRDGS